MRSISTPSFPNPPSCTSVSSRYINLLLMAEGARNTYMVVDDAITKNYDKLSEPKGDRREGSHLSMF